MKLLTLLRIILLIHLILNLEMPLINCEINLILTRSRNCVIVSTNVSNRNATFKITDTIICSSSNFINTR